MNRSLVVRRRNDRGIWRKVLLAGLLVAGVLIYKQLPEIRRYLRMRRM